MSAITDATALNEIAKILAAIPAGGIIGAAATQRLKELTAATDREVF